MNITVPAGWTKKFRPASGHVALGSKFHNSFHSLNNVDPDISVVCRTRAGVSFVELRIQHPTIKDDSHSMVVLLTQENASQIGSWLRTAAKKAETLNSTSVRLITQK